MKVKTLDTYTHYSSTDINCHGMISLILSSRPLLSQNAEVVIGSKVIIDRLFIVPCSPPPAPEYSLGRSSEKTLMNEKGHDPFGIQSLLHFLQSLEPFPSLKEQYEADLRDAAHAIINRQFSAYLSVIMSTCRRRARVTLIGHRKQYPIEPVNWCRPPACASH